MGEKRKKDKDIDRIAKGKGIPHKPSSSRQQDTGIRTEMRCEIAEGLAKIYADSPPTEGKKYKRPIIAKETADK